MKIFGCRWLNRDPHSINFSLTEEADNLPSLASLTKPLSKLPVSFQLLLIVLLQSWSYFCQPRSPSSGPVWHGALQSYTKILKFQIIYTRACAHTHTTKWTESVESSWRISQAKIGPQIGDPFTKDSRDTSRNILEHQGSDHISITLLTSSFQLWKQTFCRLHFKFRFWHHLLAWKGSWWWPSSYGCFLRVQLPSNLCFPDSFHSFLHWQLTTHPTFFSFNSWKWIRPAMASFKRES